MVVARFSAEASAAAHLDDVCRWLIETQGTPVRLGVDDVPALGQVSWLKLGRPIVAPQLVEPQWISRRSAIRTGTDASARRRQVR